MTSVQTQTFRLVGGRHSDSVSPSVAALTPPVRRARGREELTLLLLLDLEESAPQHIHQELRDLAQHTFWSATGSVTAALRQTVSAVNRHLFQHNLRVTPEDRLYGGLTCAALREEEAFIAQAGPAWAAILCAGSMEQITQKGSLHLGSAAYTDTRLSYFALAPEDRLIVASWQLGQAAPNEVFQRILAQASLDALAGGLEQIGAGLDCHALLAQWSAAAAPLEAAERAPKRPRQVPVPPTPRAAPSRPPQAAARPARTPAKEAWQRFAQTLGHIATAIAGVPATIARGLKTLVLTIFGGLQTLVRHMLPGQSPTPARAATRTLRPPPPENARLMAALALIILIVVTLVTIWTWTRYSDAIYETQMLDQAGRYIDMAQAATSPEVARDHLENALLALANIMESPDAAPLRQQVQAAIDRIDGVVWVEPVLLYDFGAQTAPRRLIVHGQSIFVLDAASNSVSRLTLTESGDQVGGVETLFPNETFGTLVDVTWAGPGNGRSADVMLMLESPATLVVYDPAWYDPSLTPNRLYPETPPNQAVPVAAGSFDGNLYLLDAQTSQIWRYAPQGEGYPSRESYFPATPPHPLHAARDMAIDGNIYVLLADGSLVKYFLANAVSFEVTGVPEPAPAFQALAVNPDRRDGPIYLADSADERIVVLSKDGAFGAQLRARDGAFASLQTIAFQETTGRLFILAGGRLYVLALDELS